MRLITGLCALLLASGTPAIAGFNSWTAESEDDPFSGGNRTTVDYSNSVRSGVLIICDTAQPGLMVRAVPGFAFEAGLSDVTPEMEFAIDGAKILGQVGRVGAVGDNIAAAETQLSKENSEAFVKAFAAATKQIAIKDGISDRPFLLTARGSTKAGAALVKCMAGQK
ncbi:hypothetical protein [Shinella zoogloeoides]|uniref:Uncharacterized protein n=1 Tax=Shinella zoogloeoides TaxID=352475 RepID=A0A6N8TH96_SHIZO|nr:hypothetical protein [Shinella zoogloeoides]MXO01566.1 hypothetical protein [Shinella zoogloeoides]UEX80196.1 hypothetical protein K8M09_11205 [Shinella zoogloeoides]